MSGVFLVVWDKQEKEKSVLLRTTTGGYPHMTLVYTGNKVNIRSLTCLSAGVSMYIGEDLHLDTAVVNSFTRDDGTERHDVLMTITKTDDDKFRGLSDILHQGLGIPINPNRILHVTHSTHSTRAEAEAELAAILPLLPYTVRVTGVCFD